jgi:hypothetical protein
MKIYWFEAQAPRRALALVKRLRVEAAERTGIPNFLVTHEPKRDQPATGDKRMRVMVIVKATKQSEAGVMPGAELLEDMVAYNEKLIAAGIMTDGAGLKPTSEGARVAFSGAERNVSKGPFGNVEDLVAGYWIWKVKDLDEAIDWVKRCPNPMPGPSAIEIRPLYEMEDFA